jgi:rod shape-determining protein MreC
VRLQFLRVMRSHPGTSLDDPGDLIGPPWPFPEDADVSPDDGEILDEARLDNASAATP